MLRNNQTYQPCKYIVFEGCFYGINDNDDDGIIVMIIIIIMLMITITIIKMIMVIRQ